MISSRGAADSAGICDMELPAPYNIQDQSRMHPPVLYNIVTLIENAVPPPTCGGDAVLIAGARRSLYMTLTS